MANVRALYARYRVELWLLLGGLCIVCVSLVVQGLTVAPPVTMMNYQDHRAGIGVPLDDVYIHCRYAENLLAGKSFSFNPGETVTADTSPLWVVLLAIGGIFTSRLENVAVFLSALLYILSAIGVYRASRYIFHLSQYRATLAGVLTLIASRLVWSAMSGMETALAALLMLLVVEEHEREAERRALRWREGMWLGLGVMVRPEFLFIALLVVLDWIIRRRSIDFSGAITSALVFFSLSAPAIGLNLLTRNSIASHSSVVQGARLSVLPDIGYLGFVLLILGAMNIIAIILFFTGMPQIAKRRELWLALAVVVGLPVFQAFVAPVFRHHGRYVFPIIPLLFVLAMSVEFKAFARLPKLAFCVLLIAPGVFDMVRWIRLESEAVRNINDQHLAVADWLGKNLRPRDVLAVHDVGAIGYFTGRPVIDLTGLVSPAMYPLQHDQDSVWRRARAEGANTFVIYTRLNPSFYAHHKDSLDFVTEFRVRKPLISAADTVMSVFRVKEVPHGS